MLGGLQDSGNPHITSDQPGAWLAVSQHCCVQGIHGDVTGGVRGHFRLHLVFFSIAQLKGEVNVQLMKQFPFGWLIFQNRFLFREQSPPSQKPAASAGLVMGCGAPPNVSLPWDLRKALSAAPEGTNMFPSKAVGGAGPEGKRSRRIGPGGCFSV